jgi:hypothetical protein
MQIKVARGFAPRQNRSIPQLLCVVLAAAAVSGCVTPWMKRPKDAAEESEARRIELKKFYESEQRPRLIREVAPRPAMTLSRIENVGLVTSLPKTGGKVNSSSQRDKLLDEMRRREVKNPNQILDDANTAMVVAQMVVPPVAQKGDRYDVIVKLSQHAEASDLQGGWLMRTNLMEMSLLGGRVREGFDYATVEGALVTQAQIRGVQKPEDAVTGVVIGGGVLHKPRTIGLRVDEEFEHAITMAAILPAINKRFTVFDGAKQVGAATPRRDNFVELEVPPRYRGDPYHFTQVVVNLGILEKPEQMRERMESCRLQLAEPTTARQAACQLEAIGKDGIPILLEALKSPSKEVRFYAAHSLGYLNDSRAVPVLVELAQTEPAFRAMCFNALRVIDRFEARDAIEALLHYDDPEVRFGALLTLRDRDPGEAIVHGQKVGDVGRVLSIATQAKPMVIVSLTRAPEVIVFGDSPRVNLPGFMYVNPRLLLRTRPDGRIGVSHLAPDKEDRLTESTGDLVSLLSAMTEVGANYGDWVNCIRLLKEGGHLSSEVAINPVPAAGRQYDRDADQGEPGDVPLEGSLPNAPAVSPPPELIEANKEKVLWYNPLTWFAP